jgi:ubiquinone/menaquinone biosynthesis C-methylase UbiE
MNNKFIKYVGNNFGNPNGIGGKITTKIMNFMNQNQYKAVLDNIELNNEDVLLDIGFGNGYLINKLLKKNNQMKIYGIEISNDMLKIVSQKYKQYINNNCLKLLLENINKTSFENELFDKLYTVNTVYFWNNLEQCFSEIKRILKPNGIFINVIYTKEYLDKIKYTKYGFNKYSKDELINITEENGMKIKEIVEIKKNKSYCIISENVK